MSKNVFVVSEWLPKPGRDDDLKKIFKSLLTETLEKEPGCLRAHVTHQITHPGSPGTSKYTIVLLQQYETVEAFDHHCASDYVANFFEKYLADEEASMVADWTCRLFAEDE